jgi:hypothetical protein
MQKRYRFFRWFAAVIFLSFGFLYGQQHFMSVANTGDYSTIVIQNAVIDNTSLQNGDEIAVFDGTLCVGAITFQGIFPINCPGIMEFVPPSGSPLPGAKDGNPMSFKLWRQSTSTEINAIPVYTSGGNFGDILTVVNPLFASSTDVKTGSGSNPDLFFLEQNYPNPFNPETTLSFHLPESAQTHMILYDVTGKKIRTLIDRTMEAGSHSIVWDGKDDQNRPVCSGVYLLRMKAGDYEKTRRLLLAQ